MLVFSVSLPSLFSPLFSSSPRTRSLEGPELADGHYGGYSAGFSRVSRKLTRECVPPEGQGTPSGTGSPPSPSPFTPPPPGASISFSLSLCATHPSHFTAARNPPYAPSGSYLRVLLIFSYYRRWACRHVSLTHPRAHGTYVHGVRSTSRSTGLPPSPSFVSTRPSASVPYAPLPPRPLPPLGAPQVLQYVSTLLQARERGEERARDSLGESREGAKTR